MNFKRLIAKGLRVVLQPPAITDSFLDRNSKVLSGSQVNYSQIKRYSYVGHNCFILNAEIGPFVSIADNVRIGGHEHDINMVSTSPVFNSGNNVMNTNFADFLERKDLKTVIEPDVWIGANSLIKSGVTIGIGSVIGMGSVVTRDIPPYEVWAGNPAKKIKDRFDEDTKNRLLYLSWWEWSNKDIKKYSKYFNNPNELYKRILMNDESRQR